MAYKAMGGAIAMASASRGPGTYTSGLLGNPDFNRVSTTILVSTSASTGSPSLDCSVETSTDSGLTWTAVPGSAAATLTGPGSSVVATTLNNTDDFRVTSTVSGSGSPTITYQVTEVSLSQ